MDTDRAVNAMQFGTQEVKIGNDVVGIAGTQFAQIEQLIANVDQLIKESASQAAHIASDSKTILHSVEAADIATKKITEDIDTISAATEQQSASVEGIAASSHGLSKMAETLKGVASKFKF